MSVAGTGWHPCALPTATSWALGTLLIIGSHTAFCPCLSPGYFLKDPGC